MELQISKESFEAKDLPAIGVTVYGDRAEVKRLIKTTVFSGRHEILIKRISHCIDKDSIRVDGRGSAIIIEVQYKQTAANRQDVDNERIKNLINEKTELENKKLKLNDDAKLLKRQQQVIDGVADRVSERAGDGDNEDKKRATFSVTDDTLESLTKFLNFYDTSVTNLQDKLRMTESKLERLVEQIATIEKRIQELKFGTIGNFKREISIIIDSENGGDLELFVSYQIHQASWAPSYDIRVINDADGKDEKSSLKARMSKRELGTEKIAVAFNNCCFSAIVLHWNPPQMFYYGMVRQNTGEDWSECQLVLSTAIPSIGGVVPTLPTLMVGLSPPSPTPIQSRRTFVARAASTVAAFDNFSPAEQVMDAQAGSFDMQKMQIAETEANKNALLTNFSINRPTSIPSDGTEHRVTVAILELDTRFEHETVPSKSPMAFLTAKVVNKSDFPILSGPTAIYLDNSFIAKSELKSVSPMEQFDLSLGMDPSVRVDYKPAYKYHEKVGFLAKMSVQTHEQLINIKNTKVAETVKIVVREQLPKSTDESVKITLVHPELSKYSSAHPSMIINNANNIEWTVFIPPKESLELKFKWKIEHSAYEKLEFHEA